MSRRPMTPLEELERQEYLEELRALPDDPRDEIAPAPDEAVPPDEPPPPPEEQAVPVAPPPPRRFAILRDENTSRRIAPRSRTIASRRLSREEMAAGARLYLPFDVERPTTRADCLAGGVNEERPCPWVSCKYHLALDVNPEIGSVKINFPDKEPWELVETCALDVADRGGITLEEVGELTNVTRERTRQIETKGLLQLRMDGSVDDMTD